MIHMFRLSSCYSRAYIQYNVAVYQLKGLHVSKKKEKQQNKTTEKKLQWENTKETRPHFTLQRIKISTNLKGIDMKCTIKNELRICAKI